MAYVGCKTTRASQIRQEALKHGGVSRLYPQKTKRDAIFKVLDLDYKEEILRLKILKEENKWKSKKDLMQDNGIYTTI